MKRRQLFEFEDLSWFPRPIRNYMTDFLRFLGHRFDFYKGLVPLLERGVRAGSGNRIVDLCSGGGGAWSTLAPRLQTTFPDLKIRLTDLYPNPHSAEMFVREPGGRFSFEPRPVDARDVPDDLTGLRTMFLSFHHFTPSDATRILRGAIEQRQPILIAEAQRRDLLHLAKHSLSPLAVLLMTPLIRPFRWGRLLATYLVPVVPACVFWDGLVSVLRAYTPNELEALASAADDRQAYRWESGQIRSGAVANVFLLGVPADPGA